MDQDTLFERVRAQADFGAAGVEEPVRAVLATLGQFLTPDEAAPLLAELPEALAGLLHPTVPPAPLTLDEVYARVAERAGLSRVRALEVTQIVCHAIGASLDPDARSRLAAHLGPLFQHLFESRPEPPPPSRPPHGAEPPPLGEGHTLATGRPGSHHPLSESHPQAGHTHSVALSDNPHADSKLSSARGLTQEVLDETLAAGRPGPERTVADTKD